MKKNRLLNDIGNIDDNIILEADAPMVKAKKSILLKVGAIAACLTLLVGGGIGANHLINSTSDYQIAIKSPVGDSPMGPRKFLNYDGNRYAFIENGSTFEMVQKIFLQHLL